MYVRFVIPTTDDDSGQRQGVFQTAYDLVDSHALPDFLHEELQALLSWFRANLRRPKRMSRSKRGDAHSNAISWFKDSSIESISRMHTICRILEDHGLHTEMLTSDRPGYVVFEDDQQVAAVPFSDTDA